MRKRSFTIAGHRTSIALEDEFWQAVEEIAEAKNLSLTALVAEIDEMRETTNLSSAIRLFVLNHIRQRDKK